MRLLTRSPCEDVVLDIPGQLRDVVTFRTTLGHKTNHKGTF